MKRTMLCLLAASLLAGCRSPEVEIIAPSPSIRPVSQAEVYLEEVNDWDSENTHYAQYDLTVVNTGETDITGWTAVIEAAEDASIARFWNCTISDGKDGWIVSPASYASSIPAGSSSEGIGLIVTGNTPLHEASLQIKDTGIKAVQKKSDISKPESTPLPLSSSPAISQSPSGPLHVSGIHLADQEGNIVQLRGVSTHGLGWYPWFVNEDAFRTLRNEWGADVIRLANYTEEANGYCSDGDQDVLKEIIDRGVNAASALGMYVIIDWHILSDHSPLQNQAQAELFFSEMSAKYKDHDNVLYEICNEPSDSPWNTVIKPYAEDILSIIRSNDPDAVVLVGTNSWCQDIEEVEGNELDDPNVMYDFHFYAASHGQSYRDRLKRALDHGIPVFVTECSITEASGDGRIDYESGQKWLDLMNEYQVSFTAWSLANKKEKSCLIKSTSAKYSNWTDDDLSETGLWFKQAIAGKKQPVHN